MKISWCSFPIQHFVSRGFRGWRILIPHENKLKLVPHSTYCSGLSVWRTTTTAIFLVGEAPGWTLHGHGLRNSLLSSNPLGDGFTMIHHASSPWFTMIRHHSSTWLFQGFTCHCYHQASMLAANRSTTSHQRCLWQNPTQTLRSTRSSMSCMWSHPEMRMADLLSRFPNIFLEQQGLLEILRVRILEKLPTHKQVSAAKSSRHKSRSINLSKLCLTLSTRRPPAL